LEQQISSESLHNTMQQTQTKAAVGQRLFGETKMA